MKPGRPKSILLMTSTIKPFEGMPHNQRSDPKIRLQDYKEALTSYLMLPQGTLDEIVLVDNSGHSLDELAALGSGATANNRKVRLFSIAPSLPDCKSKPYGELDIMDQAHRQIFVHEAPETVIWKVTGRLFIPNIQELIQSYPAGSDLYCDLRSVPFIGNTLGGNPWFDMRVWAYTPRFYADHLLDLKDRIPSIDEGLLYGQVASMLKKNQKIAPRFRIQPTFSGACAANNSDYSAPSVLFKNNIRQVMRKWAPFVWL